jgi:hypothetical protein
LSKVNDSTSCDDLSNELVYTTIEKSDTNLSLENAFCSTMGKKEWTHLEKLEREHKSLIQLYHLRQEQIIELEIREMKLIEQVECLESNMKKLTRGEHKHKKMLFHHACDYGKKKLGSFLKLSKSKIHSPKVGPSFIKNVNIVKSSVIILESVLCLTSLCLPNLRILLCMKIIIFS